MINRWMATLRELFNNGGWRWQPRRRRRQRQRRQRYELVPLFTIHCGLCYFWWSLRVNCILVLCPFWFLPLFLFWFTFFFTCHISLAADSREEGHLGLEKKSIQRLIHHFNKRQQQKTKRKRNCCECVCAFVPSIVWAKFHWYKFESGLILIWGLCQNIHSLTHSECCGLQLAEEEVMKKFFLSFIRLSFFFSWHQFKPQLNCTHAHTEFSVFLSFLHTHTQLFPFFSFPMCLRDQIQKKSCERKIFDFFFFGFNTQWKMIASVGFVIFSVEIRQFLSLFHWNV